MMNELKYCFSNYKKIIKINVKYKLFGESGNTIATETFDFIPKKFLVEKYLDYNFKMWDKIIYKEYSECFNKIAKRILKDNRKKKFHKLKSGSFISGTYIIKCIWDVYIDTKDLTYEEYKKHIKSLEVKE